LGFEGWFMVGNLIFSAVLVIVAFTAFEVPKKEKRLYKYFKKFMWEKEQKELYGALTESNLDEAKTYSEVTISREGFDLYNSEDGIIAQAKFIAAIDFPPVRIPDDEYDFNKIKFSVKGNELTKITLTTFDGELITTQVSEQI